MLVLLHCKKLSPHHNETYNLKQVVRMSKSKNIHFSLFLQVAVLNETDGLVSQLYKWISADQEPLASYSIGLLALAMELNEVATDTEIRDRVATKIFEDFGGALCKAFIIGREPVTIVYYTRVCTIRTCAEVLVAYL